MSGPRLGRGRAIVHRVGLLFDHVLESLHESGEHGLARLGFRERVEDVGVRALGHPRFGPVDVPRAEVLGHAVLRIGLDLGLAELGEQLGAIVLAHRREQALGAALGRALDRAVAVDDSQRADLGELDAAGLPFGRDGLGLTAADGDAADGNDKLSCI